MYITVLCTEDHRYINLDNKLVLQDGTLTFFSWDLLIYFSEKESASMSWGEG